MSSFHQYGMFDPTDDTFRWEYWDPSEPLVPIVPVRDPHPVQESATNKLKIFRRELLAKPLTDAEAENWNWVLKRLNLLIPEMLPGRRFRALWLTPKSDFEGEQANLENLRGPAERVKAALERTGMFELRVNRGFPLPFSYGMQLEGRCPLDPKNFLSIFDRKREKHRWGFRDLEDPILPFVPSLYPGQRELAAIQNMNQWIQANREDLQSEGALEETNGAIQIVNEKVLPHLRSTRSFRVMDLKRGRDFDVGNTEVLRGVGSRVCQLLEAAGAFNFDDRWDQAMCWRDRRSLWAQVKQEGR